MTRRILAATLLAATAVSFAGTAYANTIITTSACPPGDKGVIVKAGGRTLTVCTNI